MSDMDSKLMMDLRSKDPASFGSVLTHKEQQMLKVFSDRSLDVVKLVDRVVIEGGKIKKSGELTEQQERWFEELVEESTGEKFQNLPLKDQVQFRTKKIEILDEKGRKRLEQDRIGVASELRTALKNRGLLGRWGWDRWVTWGCTDARQTANVTKFAEKFFKKLSKKLEKNGITEESMRTSLESAKQRTEQAEKAYLERARSLFKELNREVSALGARFEKAENEVEVAEKEYAVALAELEHAILALPNVGVIPANHLKTLDPKQMKSEPTYQAFENVYLAQAKLEAAKRRYEKLVDDGKEEEIPLLPRRHHRSASFGGSSPVEEQQTKRQRLLDRPLSTPVVGSKRVREQSA